MQTVAATRPKRGSLPASHLAGATSKAAGTKAKAVTSVQVLATVPAISMGAPSLEQPALHADAGHAGALTEQSLLTMPASAYMDDRQLAFFRGKLEQMRAELVESASRTTADMRDTDTCTPDPMDRATLEEEYSLELLARDRDRKTLKQVALALSRIASGDYGWCEETGEPIGLPRLLARPTAALSIGAQTHREQREQRQRMFS